MAKILTGSQEKYLSSIRSEKDSLILEMEAYAKEKSIPILDWKSAEFLEMLIEIYKPQNVLEIGMAIGYSSIRIARKLQEKAKLTTLEKSFGNVKTAKEYFKRAKTEDRIKIVEGDALEIMPALETKFDFIFLDADKEVYENLFSLSLPLLNKGGIIFIDNLLWHGYTAARIVPAKFKRSTKIIRRFNKIFLEEPSLRSSILPIGDGIGVGIKQ